MKARHYFILTLPAWLVLGPLSSRLLWLCLPFVLWTACLQAQTNERLCENPLTV